jgi:hypothetical protein
MYKKSTRKISAKTQRKMIFRRKKCTKTRRGKFFAKRDFPREKVTKNRRGKFSAEEKNVETIDPLPEQSVQLLITVIDYDRVGASEPIGKVQLGCDAKGPELRHWCQFL